MPAIFTDPAQLAAYSRFVQALQAALTQTIPCTIAAVNGGFDTEAAYSPELDLWYARAQQDKKCWNGFGLGAPADGKKVSLAAEIQLPVQRHQPHPVRHIRHRRKRRYSRPAPRQNPRRQSKRKLGLDPTKP